MKDFDGFSEQPTKLNTLLNCGDRLQMGDWILFQEYKWDSSLQMYEIQKPLLVIFLNYFIADQTIGFDYIPWINQNRAWGADLNTKILYHIAWDDYINILHIWKQKPDFKQIAKWYRDAEKPGYIKGKKIDV